MQNNFIHVNIFIVHLYNVFTVPKLLQINLRIPSGIKIHKNNSLNPTPDNINHSY